MKISENVMIVYKQSNMYTLPDNVKIMTIEGESDGQDETLV